ncbi:MULTISPECIES: RDD family protein [Kitasatospora]|uniref:RDD family protein n=1 Tax=Kitasatospora TaxID=2063 RepID=UPI000C70B83E|nr:RDD family protein [Kitasatospora sp. GP30]MDH6142528.1 putative RDD family membrane protein YckC [Kitasatospora sp. GP30]
MSSYDPSNADPEGGGKPSFDKQPSQPGANGSPYNGKPSDPGDYQGSYGGPAPGGSPYSSYGGAPGGVPQGGPTQIAGMPPLGTWPSRILARLIDYVIIQVVAFAVTLPISGFDRNGWTEGVWVYYALYLVYDGVMLSRDGQTLGKKVMNVRVAMLSDGARPNRQAAWTRAAVYTVPAVLCCGLWWLVDGMFGVFDKPYRQCIHDKAAKTVVVSTN